MLGISMQNILAPDTGQNMLAPGWGQTYLRQVGQNKNLFHYFTA
jgi:hypothetical protein